MQFELTSGSEGAAHVLYDPAVVEPQVLDDEGNAWDAWLERQTTTGRMLHYFRAGSEELLLKLYVDEPFEPPGKFTKSGEVDGAILRVESGKLALSGIEGLPIAGNESEDDAAGRQEVDVAPGTYRVTGFRADYELTPARIEAEIAPQLQPGDAARARRVERFAMPLGCTVMLVAVLAAFAFLFSAASWMWRLGAVGFVILIAVIAAVVVARLMSSPSLNRWHKAKAELWKRYPPVVVVLTRLAEGEVPATAPPARFGVA